MLDLGATTFWEHFDLAWTKNAARIDEIVPEDKVDVHAVYGDGCYRGLRHSFCHGWAVGPTAWLTEHVLGIKPVKPGCTELLIRPNLAGLDWAKGSLPTPVGIVTVSHQKTTGGKIETISNVPDNIKLIT